jgi:DNA/RNA endonuclease G (NUC1)
MAEKCYTDVSLRIHLALYAYKLDDFKDSGYDRGHMVRAGLAA